jgi:hypothetical protein
MRSIGFVAVFLLSACTYESVENLKENAGNSYSVKSARPMSDYDGEAIHGRGPLWRVC